MGLVTLNFDLLTLKLVCRSHVCWAISLPILVFLALLVLELFTMYATDRRTDGRTKATPLPYGRGHNNAPYPTGGGIVIQCSRALKQLRKLSVPWRTSADGAGTQQGLSVISDQIRSELTTGAGYSLYACISITYYIKVITD